MSLGEHDQTVLSVEELASRAGLPTTTIRMYQTKGVLHAPRRQGRTARYDESHVERLELVQRLRDRGFSLTAIAELIAARDRGASVASVLGLGETAGPDDWVRVRVPDLRVLMPAGDVRPRLLRRAGRLGLLRWRRGRPYARRWALESGLRLAELAVPGEEILDRFAALRGTTDRLAADFVAVFEQRMWPRLAAGNSTAALERTRELLASLTGTAETVVLGALRESIREAAEDFAGRHGLLPGDTAPWAPEGEPEADERTVAAYLQADDREDGVDTRGTGS